MIPSPRIEERTLGGGAWFYANFMDAPSFPVLACLLQPPRVPDGYGLPPPPPPREGETDAGARPRGRRPPGEARARDGAGAEAKSKRSEPRPKRPAAKQRSRAPPQEKP